MGLGNLKLAMLLTLTLLLGTVAGLFGILLWLFGPSLGLAGGFVAVIFFSAIIVGLQWLISPWLIKFITRMREIPENDQQLSFVHLVCGKSD